MPYEHPGRLDQRITIKRESEVADGLGGNTLSLSTLAQAWAKVRPMSGKETARFDRVNAEGMYVFIIRYRSDITITEDDRIEWEGEDYNIRNINRRGGRILYLEIGAERGVAQ